MSQEQKFTVIDGIAYPIATSPAPAATAPAAPVVASPFTVIGTRKPDGTVSSLPAPMAAAYAAAPQGHKSEWTRLAAAYNSVPNYACNAAARDMDGPDGSRTVGHGFISKRDSGVSCPTNGCKGTIL